MKRKLGKGILGLLFSLFLLGHAASSYAQQSGVTLTELKFFVVGMDITPNPEKQAVPKDLTTTVNADVSLATPEVSFSDIQSQLPADLVVKGELRGPAYPTPLTLTTKPNVPFTIPTLPLVGIYTLENIRMESGGETVAAAINVVTIESFEKALITEVTTRALTIEEIQDKGILIDTSNFNVINFTTGITFQSNPVQIQFPVLIPKVPDASIETTGGGGLSFDPPAIPALEIDIPNLQINGFVLDRESVLHRLINSHVLLLLRHGKKTADSFPMIQIIGLGVRIASGS